MLPLLGSDFIFYKRQKSRENRQHWPLFPAWAHRIGGFRSFWFQRSHPPSLTCVIKAYEWPSLKLEEGRSKACWASSNENSLAKRAYGLGITAKACCTITHDSLEAGSVASSSQARLGLSRQKRKGYSSLCPLVSKCTPGYARVV